jgi:phage shock protein PspC (stress-responsive transcriptional regulator)
MQVLLQKGLFMTTNTRKLAPRIFQVLLSVGVVLATLHAHAADQLPYTQTFEGITVQARRLSPQEIEALFEGRGRALLRRNNPITPIALSITNKGEVPVVCDKSLISLPLVDYNTVLKRLYHSPARRIVLGTYTGIGTGFGLGLASFGFMALGACFVTWPATLGSLCIGGVLFYIGSALGIASIGCFVIMPVYGCISGVNAYLDNKALEQQQENVPTVQESVRIMPQTQQEFLIFARGKKLAMPFTISCVTETAEKKVTTFTVDC